MLASVTPLATSLPTECCSLPPDPYPRSPDLQILPASPASRCRQRLQPAVHSRLVHTARPETHSPQAHSVTSLQPNLKMPPLPGSPGSGLLGTAVAGGSVQGGATV